MRPFISETEDLVFKDFHVSEKIYKQMVSRFGSEREALNALEYQIQIHMRNFKKGRKEVKKIKVTVAIHPIIEKILDQYSYEYNLELPLVLERIMRCTKKR